MKKQMKERKNIIIKRKAKRLVLKERGITLIALVMTIIILLILSGVTLNMALSENGLFKRAKKAVEEYKTATVEEQRQLAMSEATMNFENKEYIDKNGDKAIIPAGFAVSQVEGENIIQDGLVVIDSSGNEFVWIPVKNDEDYVKKVGTYNYELGDGETDINKLQRGDDLGITNIFDEYIGNGIFDRPEKDIVVKAGGFYVGRYEAGVELNEEIKWQGDNRERNS